MLFFQSTFYSTPYISAFLVFYRSRATKKHEKKAGAPIRIFDWIFAGRIFFIAGTLQKNMFFVFPIPFRTYTKHFRRFLNSFWSSAEQRWFRENQRWTALKQPWSALVFLTHSETALISAETYKISETALFSADLLWDFNPGILGLGICPSTLFPNYNLKFENLVNGHAVGWLHCCPKVSLWYFVSSCSLLKSVTGKLYQHYNTETAMLLSELAIKRVVTWLSIWRLLWKLKSRRR